MTTLPTLYHQYEEDFMIIETDASEYRAGVLKVRNKKNEEFICKYSDSKMTRNCIYICVNNIFLFYPPKSKLLSITHCVWRDRWVTRGKKVN